MKLVVTGAGGWLGRALARFAAARGAQVFGIGRAPAPPPDWPGAGWRSWDMRAAPAEAWPEAEGAEVVHLAGETAIRAADSVQVEDAVCLARRAAELAHRLGGGLIVVSSAAVYSGPRTEYPVAALREHDPVEPRTHYGRAKLAAEDAARDALPATCVLRLFSIFDESLPVRAGRGHLIESLARALRDGTPITLVLDAEGRPAVRDYLTPEQFAEVVWRAARWAGKPDDPLAGRIINVGTGVPTTTREIIEFAAEFWGRPLPWSAAARTNAESAVLLADVSRLRELLGWVPDSVVKNTVARLARSAAVR